MSTMNSTYHYQQGRTEGHDAYVLPPEIAASLRVPKITYPNNKIPVAIAKKCIPNALTCARLQDADGGLLLADVMDLIESSILESRLACTSCQTICEHSAKWLSVAA